MVDTKHDQGFVLIFDSTVYDHVGEAGDDHLAGASEKSRTADMRQMLEQRYDLANARADACRSRDFVRSGSRKFR